jgi:drug/metabolite transporter (DMT)-like permease
MESRSSSKLALLYLLSAALLWSIGGLFIRLVELNPFAIAGIRSGIAACSLGVCCRSFKFTGSQAQIGSAIAYASTVFFFVLGIQWTTVATTCFLQYTAPLYIALFSRCFLNEPLKRLDWISMALVFPGITLFFLDRLEISHLKGNICSLISGISLAWVTLFLRKQKESSSMESLILGNILCFLLCTPFYFEKWPTFHDWTCLLILGIFQLGLSYWFYAQALKYVNAIEAILIPIIAPVLNPLWVLLFLGEVPGFWSLCGGVLVLGTVTFRSILFLKNNKH